MSPVFDHAIFQARHDTDNNHRGQPSHLDVDVKVVPGFRFCIECQVTGPHEPVIEYN